MSLPLPTLATWFHLRAASVPVQKQPICIHACDMLKLKQQPTIHVAIMAIPFKLCARSIQWQDHEQQTIKYHKIYICYDEQ